jgi:CHAD domain-containing protein
VQLALIRNLEDHTPQAAPALVLVRQDYESERLAKTRRLIKTLERLDVDALLRNVSGNHPAALRHRLVSNGWRHQVKHLVVERARNAIGAIAHATGVYFPRRTHGARIAIKQLRYAAEMAEATGLSALEPPIKALRKAQDILGELHDRQALADTLEYYARHDEVKKANVEVAREVLEREVAQLHREYLARRPALRDACAEIERATTHAWSFGRCWWPAARWRCRASSTAVAR